MQVIVETATKRIIRLLNRRGILDCDQLDPLVEKSPILAGVTAASVQGMIATGERAGMRVRRVLQCSLCGGKMKIVAAVTDPCSIKHYLEGTGQSASLPELAPARAPPQTEFDY